MPNFTDPRTGCTWSADTQEALMDLYQKVMELDAAPIPETVALARPTSTPTQSIRVRTVPDELWVEFDQALSMGARQLLIWVKKRGTEPFTAEEAVVHLPTTESSGIGGTLSGIRRRSKRIFGDSEAVLTRNPHGKEFAIGILLATHDLSPATQWENLVYEEDV